MKAYPLLFSFNDGLIFPTLGKIWFQPNQDLVSSAGQAKIFDGRHQYVTRFKFDFLKSEFKIAAFREHVQRRLESGEKFYAGGLTFFVDGFDGATLKFNAVSIFG